MVLLRTYIYINQGFSLHRALTFLILVAMLEINHNQYKNHLRFYVVITSTKNTLLSKLLLYRGTTASLSRTSCTPRTLSRYRRVALFGNFFFLQFLFLFLVCEVFSSTHTFFCFKNDIDFNCYFSVPGWIFEMLPIFMHNSFTRAYRYRAE